MSGLAVIRVFSRGQRHVLDVLAIHRVEELDARARLSRRLEAVQALVLNEGIERADDADLGGAAHLVLCVIGEVFADLLARPLVVDADESGIVAVGDTGVDRDDGNAGLLRRGDGGLHPIDVNGDEHDAVDFLGDIVLDCAVLGRGDVVGVEDDELRARLVRRLLGAVVDLVEEERLLVDRDERDCLRICRLGANESGGRDADKAETRN